MTKAAKQELVASSATTNQQLAEAFKGEDYGDSIQVEFTSFPTIKLVQAMSKEAHEGLAQAGQFFHNILQVPVEQPMQIIPLVIRTTYSIWKPISEGGGMIARSTDGKTWDKQNFEFTLNIDGVLRKFNTKANVKASGLAEWGSSIPGNSNSKPVADMSIVIFGILKDNPEYGPFRVLLRSTALKDTNRFIQLLGNRRTIINNGVVSHLPPFAFEFKLSSIRKTESGKSWHIPVFSDLKLLDVAGADKDFVDTMRDTYLMHKSQFDKMAVMDTDNEVEATPIPEGTEF